MSYRFAIVAMIAAAPAAQGQVVIHLRTDAFATPVVVPDDPQQRSVTAFEIVGDLPVGGHGPGMITFDERPVTFNEFGDPTRLPGAPVVPIPIVFKEVALGSVKFPARRTLEIVFLDGSLPEQLYLALGADGQGPHRLLIRAPDAKPLWVPQVDDGPHGGFGLGGSLVHLIEMYGQPAIDDRLPDTPVGSRINLSAMTVPGSKRGPTRLSVRGTIDGHVWVELDGNQRTFDILGNVTSSTRWPAPSPRATSSSAALRPPAATIRSSPRSKASSGPASHSRRSRPTDRRSSANTTTPGARSRSARSHRSFSTRSTVLAISGPTSPPASTRSDSTRSALIVSACLVSGERPRHRR